MAGTTTKSRDNGGHEQGALRDLIIQHNKLVDDVENLRNVLATHTHTGANPVAPTAATITTVDAAADLTASKIGNENGTAITS